MAEINLKQYIARIGSSQAELSKDIGRTPQALHYWVQQNAKVELTDIGIRIRMPSGLIVYESQVLK